MQTSPWWDLRSVTASWGLREESAEACAARLVRHLALLEPLHPAISELRLLTGKKPALFPLPAPAEDHAGLFHAQFDRDEKNRKILSDGIRLQAVANFGSERFLQLYIVAGVHKRPASASPRYGINSVTLSTVVTDVFGEDRPLLASFQDMLLATIEAWEPDRACFHSHNYGALTHDVGSWPAFSEGSWAVYVATPRAREVTPPPSCFPEPVGKGGLLMMATQGHFDHRNTEQRAVAEAIQAAVAPIGL